MVEPFISLNGRAEEAINFYETVFNGTVIKITRLSEVPIDPSITVPDNMKNHIGLAEMNIYGTVFHFSDVQDSKTPGDMFAFMIRYKTVEELTEVYNNLMDGGEIDMELAPVMNEKTYACVKDKFGIEWRLICE